MTKLLLTFSFFIGLVSTSYPESTAPIVTQVGKQHMPDELMNSKRLVICKFKLPNGHVIEKVLRGDKKLRGQNWNSRIFPKQSILVYEVYSDNIGDTGGATIVNTVGYYLYDSDTEEIYQIDIYGKKAITTTLPKLRAALKIASAEQDAAPNR
ncbi:hypothetical protein ACFSW8_03770 [Rubritalea tangerina]|uniref:Secreted protein n=1 Tax=Rubritalea tangerina TaxID=430798 RepID=A0ABW4Z853_9BACT